MIALPLEASGLRPPAYTSGVGTASPPCAAWARKKLRRLRDTTLLNVAYPDRRDVEATRLRVQQNELVSVEPDQPRSKVALVTGAEPARDIIEGCPGWAHSVEHEQCLVSRLEVGEDHWLTVDLFNHGHLAGD
jgi:hypothetical protein